MKIIYGLICDGGDGSANMRWFDDLDLVKRLCDEEEYYQNEGSPAETLTFPDDLDLKACGFDITNASDVGLDD